MSAARPPVKAIILDVFDTVLLSSGKARFKELYSQVYDDYNVTNSHDLSRSHDYNELLTQEISFGDYFDRYGDTRNSSEQKQGFLANMQEIFAEEKASFAPRDEWDDFLQQADERNLTLCLGSNLSLPYTEIVEEKLAPIPHKVYSCAIGIRKPDPKFFQTCCDIMNVDPSETIMIGNSFASDMKGAQNANLAHGFWIPTMRNLGATLPSNMRKIKSLTDVFATLDNRG